MKKEKVIITLKVNNNCNFLVLGQISNQNFKKEKGGTTNSIITRLIALLKRRNKNPCMSSVLDKEVKIRVLKLLHIPIIQVKVEIIKKMNHSMSLKSMIH